MRKNYKLATFILYYGFLPFRITTFSTVFSQYFGFSHIIRGHFVYIENKQLVPALSTLNNKLQ